jgi:RES domain-containing protein
MRLYRIARRPYANLGGDGGLQYPGRWHDRGSRILSTSPSIALAAIEFAVHSNTRPADTMLVEIQLDDGVELVDVSDIIGGPLPANWASDHGHTRPLGTAWLAKSRTS